MSNIVNSAVANTIFSTAGTPISSQPDNSKTKFAGPTVSNNRGSNVDTGQYTNDNPSGLVQGMVGFVDADSLGSISAITNSSGNTQFSVAALNPPSQDKVGSLLLTNKGYLFKILSIVPASSAEDPYDIVLDIPYGSRNDFINSSSLSDVLSAVNLDSIKPNKVGKYIFLGDTDEIAGSSNKAIQGGASSPNRDVNSSASTRTIHVGAQIRAGSWNKYTGTWATAPTGVDDTALINSANDKAHSGDGRISFYQPSAPDSQSL